MLRAAKLFWQHVLRLAATMQKAMREGKLKDGDDFTRYMDKLLGVDTQKAHEAAVEREVEKEGEAFSLGRIHPGKIKSILDGTYEPDADDNLRARAFERAVRSQDDLYGGFGGRTPTAVSWPRQPTGSQRLGASFIALFTGWNPVFFYSEEEVAPGGVTVGSGIIGGNGQETVEAHLKAAHEIWHWIKQN